MKSKNNKDPEDTAFKGYQECLRTVIVLNLKTPRSALAKDFFKAQMSDYFKELSEGKIGWGISFNGWLELNGWKCIGFLKYKRVRSLQDDLQEFVYGKI